MDPRKEKRLQEITRLRDLPPEETVAMTFGLMRFMRRLSEAADRARP